MRKQKRTYGAKRSAFSTASTAIFGSNAKGGSPPIARSALEDVTEAVNNIKLGDDEASEDDDKDEQNCVTEAGMFPVASYNADC